MTTARRIPLQRIYVDALADIRPYLMKAVDADALKCRERGITGPIDSIDDVMKDGSLGAALRAAVAGETKRLAAIFGNNKDEQGRMIVPPEYEAKLKQLLLVVNYEYHALLNFRLSGEKVFNFSDTLITLLAQTSSNVKCEYVVAPFPASIFVTKSVVAINLLYSFLRGEAAGDPAERRAGVEYDIPLTVFVLELPPSRLPHPSIAFYVFQCDVRKQAAMTKRVLYLNPEWSVEQALKTDWTAIEHGKGLSSQYTDLVAETDEHFYSDGLAFFRVLDQHGAVRDLSRR